MRYFSAQYVYTNASVPLKRPVITTADDGTIQHIEDTGGALTEKHSVEFFNGIIVPGFVNCHSHLELSHMKGKTAEGKGLAGFISEIRNSPETEEQIIIKAIKQADNEMFNEGILICGDICNTSTSFRLKKVSPIHYISFLEIYGIDNSKAQKRINEILSLAEEAKRSGLTYYIVPHSVYSVSENLFRLIKGVAENNRVSSIHFLESEAERTLLGSHSGTLMDSYLNFGIPLSGIRTVNSHTEAVREKMTLNGNLILVHNTFIKKEEIKVLKKRKYLYWCLCPGSNLYIENQLPPVDLLLEEGCEIVLGTDSKGSNSNLSILNEMITLQENFDSVSTEMVVKWATLNGARALCQDSWAGSVEPGKKPGLVLIENFDFGKHRLVKGSTARRLI
jgi:aminodeoxyfutalosine deaminase